jgi:hypothetical protein
MPYYQMPFYSTITTITNYSYCKNDVFEAHLWCCTHFSSCYFGTEWHGMFFITDETISIKFERIWKLLIKIEMIKTSVAIIIKMMFFGDFILGESHVFDQFSFLKKKKSGERVIPRKH